MPKREHSAQPSAVDDSTSRISPWLAVLKMAGKRRVTCATHLSGYRSTDDGREVLVTEAIERALPVFLVRDESAFLQE